MPLFLGQRTAEYILDMPIIDQLEYSVDVSLEDAVISQRELSKLDLSILENVPKPIDVLVSSHGKIRTREDIKCHRVFCPLPDRSFIEIAPDIFVASPMLCLVLRARELTLAQTIVLGSRFCGTFALDKNSPTGIREREKPIASIEDILLYTQRCAPIAGIKRARRAAELILPNAASPMETISALPFYLPCRLGGFGFSAPTLNYRQPLQPSARKLTNKEFIRIDLYWEEFGFGFEYQGRFCHSSDSDISDDIARQLAAERQGIELQMITIGQIRDLHQRLYLAQKLSRRIGESFPADEGFLLANQSLVDELV